jgi:hypothetical protein
MTERFVLGGSLRRWIDDPRPPTAVAPEMVEAGAIYRRGLHYGIGVGGGQLIDCDDGRGREPVRLVSWSDFSAGRPVFELDDSDGYLHAHWLWRRRYRCRPRQETVRRARQFLSWRGRYDLAGAGGVNCIMFALYCKAEEYERPEAVPWIACEHDVKLK